MRAVIGIIVCSVGLLLLAGKPAGAEDAPMGGLKGLPGAVKDDAGAAVEEEVQGVIGKGTGTKKEDADEADDEDAAGKPATKGAKGKAEETGGW